MYWLSSSGMDDSEIPTSEVFQLYARHTTDTGLCECLVPEARYDTVEQLVRDLRAVTNLLLRFGRPSLPLQFQYWL